MLYNIYRPTDFSEVKGTGRCSANRKKTIADW